MTSYLKKEEDLLSKIIELTSFEKFQGSSKESITYFKEFHLKIRDKFSELKIITIGGTNGKGHIAYALEDLLVKNRTLVAKWSSPHLYSICERISFGGRPISGDQLEVIVDKVHSINGKYNFSFYEFLFACFCEYIFALEQLEVLILEVGLGGRLDTVNLFDTDLSCLSSVGLDHTEYLGDTLKEILLEKVEISRKGKLHLSSVGIDYLQKIESDFVSKRGGTYRNIHDSKLNYFEQNKKMVEKIFQFLYKGKSFANDVLNNLNLGPGRLQELSFRHHTLVFNGSHNPDGFKALTDYFYRESKKFDCILLGFADRSVKELSQILKIIKKYPCCFTEIKMTYFNHPRALAYEASCQVAQMNQIPFVNYSEFLDTMIEQKNAKKVLVTGSNYFLSEVYKQLHI